MALREARCRSCEAPIWWLENVKTGKKAPIDTDPDAKGNIIVSEEDEQYRIANESDGRLEPRYTNHFQTCPSASEWRKK